VCRKTIPLVIIDEDSYEKDMLFYAQLGEIRMLDGESTVIYFDVQSSDTLNINAYIFMNIILKEHNAKSIHVE
jgi:hypothetical protein